MQSNGELDRMIDSALAEYSNAQPLAGLEERVLNRIRLVEGARRRAFGWVAAIAVAASVVLVSILVRMPRTPAPPGNGIVPVPALAPSRPVPEAAELHGALKRHHGGIVRKRAEAPKPVEKLKPFPTPQPLTAEERTLRGFVERYPEEAGQALTQLQNWSNNPITIEPIQITPIQTNRPLRR
jgi:hypothetical protein